MQNYVIDRLDSLILYALGENPSFSLNELQRKSGILSTSTISRRVKKLRQNGFIKGERLVLDYEKLGYGFITVTFVKARYGPGYVDRVAEKIKKIQGVESMVFLLGDIDFLVTTYSKSKEDYGHILEELTKIEEIERTDSRTVLKAYDQNRIKI